MYRRMTHILLNTPYEDVQEWILFVPQQMFDRELQQMIGLYLETRGDSLSEKMLKAVIPAIKELHAHGLDMSHIAQEHRPRFAKYDLSAELDEVVGVAVDGPLPWWKRIF